MCLGGTFDYANKVERLEEVEHELSQGDVWDNPERAQELGKERASLEAVVKTIDTLDAGLGDARDLLDMAVEEDDESAVEDIRAELENLETSQWFIWLMELVN